MGGPPLRVPPSHAGSGAAAGSSLSPALTFAIGMGLLLCVPLLLALTVASCWRRCQKQLATRRWSREGPCHGAAARWSECREDPSDEEEEEPITPRQRAIRPGRVPRRVTVGHCAARAGAGMYVLEVGSLYVKTDRAKTSLTESTSDALIDTSLAGCCGVKSTCGGIEVASSAVPLQQSRSERQKCRRPWPS